MERMTFIRLIEKTLDETKKPLTTREIWDEAKNLGFDKELGSIGKTPWDTIGAYLYDNIKKTDPIFIKVSTRPTRFSLKKYAKALENWKAPETEEAAPLQLKNEREYHPILVRFIDSEFKSKAKTIFHELSSKGKRGLNEWLHPDVVGVFFPFGEYEPATIDLQKHLASSSVKIFSFELKKVLNFSCLREYYFQAVSNSSWAHEGYLAVLKIDKDSELMKELGRLNTSFGIGVIELNEEQPEESEILFPARARTELDWDTLNLLASKNPDFSSFIVDVKKDLTTGDVRGAYDKIERPK